MNHPLHCLCFNKRERDKVGKGVISSVHLQEGVGIKRVYFWKIKWAYSGTIDKKYQVWDAYNIAALGGVPYVFVFVVVIVVVFHWILTPGEIDVISPVFQTWKLGHISGYLRNNLAKSHGE